MGKREPADIEERLRAFARTPIAIREATQGMSEPHALASPAPGEWSVAQVVTHLWIVDGLLLVTFAGAERPREAVMRPRNPASFPALLDAFELRRATLVAALRDFAPKLWDTPFTFRTRESTARQLVTRFVRHDATHLRQIAALRRTVERPA